MIRTPRQLEGDSFPTGKSFSLSPHGGGFAMHLHAAAWLGLLQGEKAWFVADPKRMGPELPWYGSAVPLVLHARVWAKEFAANATRGLARPLFCVQQKGGYEPLCALPACLPALVSVCMQLCIFACVLPQLCFCRGLLPARCMVARYP